MTPLSTVRNSTSSQLTSILIRRPTSHLTSSHIMSSSLSFAQGNSTHFVWRKTPQEMNFVAFYDVSQIIQDIPRLGDYNDVGPPPMPPIDQIPLSAKSSRQSFETITPPSSTTKSHAPFKLHPLSKQSTSTSIWSTKTSKLLSMDSNTTYTSKV